MPKVPWGRETVAGLAGAIGSVPDGMATAVLAGANPMAGLYASFAGPTAGGLMQSTRVMVVATTSAAAVTTAELMNAGPDDPIRTLATLTVLAGVFMILATRLGLGEIPCTVSLIFTTYAGMDIGRDNGGVVDRDYEDRAPYAFTGTVRSVVFGLKPAPIDDEEGLHRMTVQTGMAHEAAG